MTLPKASGVVIEDNAQYCTTSFSRNDIPGLSLRVAYYNYTGYDLSIVNRYGVAHKLVGRPRIGGLNKSLYVTVSYDVSDSETVILDRPEISDSDPDYRNFSLARASEKTQRAGFGKQTRTVTVVQEIPDEKIVNNQVVYYRDLDVVISLSDYVSVPKHPYEFTGALRNELLNTDGLLEADEFRFGILLVDNNGRVGPRFVNINGRLYRVPAARRPNLKDGVYIKASESVNGDTGLPPPSNISYFTVDDYESACKDDVTLLRLFTSINQARSLGDMQSARKAELEQIAHDRRKDEEEWRNQRSKDERENVRLKARIEEQSQQYEQEKREWERRSTESDRQRKDLEHQMKLNDLQFQSELQRLKHEQTMQKMDREKESKEGWNVTVKDVAVLIAGVTACATAIGGLYKLYKSYDKE